MKIALVSPYEFTEEPGGVKDFILGLKSALLEKGHIAAIIAPGSKETEKEGLIDYALGMPFKLSTDQTEFKGSFSRKKTAREILEKVKPDIIVIHEPLVPTIGHTMISTVLRMKDDVMRPAGNRMERQPMAGRPIVIGQFHARREGFGFRLKAIEFIGKHLIRRPRLNRRTVLGLSAGYISTINKNLDARIAVSEASREFWEKKYQGEYKVIYNGINAEELTPNGEKIESWKEQDKTIILFAGRHDSRKGIDDLIEAFNLLTQAGNSDLRLKITGKGEMTEDLRELVKKLGLETFVEFVGVLPRSELIKAYRTADLLVAPSVDGEGFNRTIAEARSCGTLVVCTNIDGQKEAIGRELSRFMARPKNPKSLARQIKTVLNLPQAEKQRIRKLGREDVIARFDWSNIAKQHIDFYENLLSSK